MIIRGRPRRGRDLSIEATFTYRDFHDVPRMIFVASTRPPLLLVSRFDDEADEYEPSYRVYEMSADVDLSGSWHDLEDKAVRTLGTVSVAEVRLDPTRRARIDVASVRAGLRT